jgi:quercetin dioxygenase-like cupin family protein
VPVLPKWLTVRIAAASAAVLSARSSPSFGSPVDVHDERYRDTLLLVHDRLCARVAASRSRDGGILTVCRRDLNWVSVSDSVRRSALYRSGDAEPKRPGEPSRVDWFEISPGGSMECLASADVSSLELLVAQGEVLFEDRCVVEAPAFRRLNLRTEPVRISAPSGALVYCRAGHRVCSDQPTPEGQPSSEWVPLLQGVNRLALWEGEQEAAFLTHIAAGATVHPHGHRFDEECVVLLGSLRIGDSLLEKGDFQLVPAGSTHDTIVAVNDVLLYQRGSRWLTSAVT